MGLSFRLAAVKEQIKKKKVPQGGARRRSRRIVLLKKLDSKSCGFEKIPEDIFMDILARLPAKLVTRLKCVSKLWSNIISSRSFTNLFLKTPSPRRLCAYIMNEEKQSEFALLSSSPDPYSCRSVSLLDQDIKMQGIGGYIVNALRGLVCFRIGTRLQICNLTTKQHVELPMITSTNIIFREDDGNPWNYFGHDSVNDEYKVLSIVWEVGEEERVLKSEHQVLVLGPGAYWRNTQSTIPPPPHCPYTQGFSINGVLYYGAWFGKNRSVSVVMSFDFASEEFTVIKLPVDEASPNLMIYGGKLAVFYYSTKSLASDGSVDLWIMEDARKCIWSNKKSLVLPISKMYFVSFYHMRMQGTSRSSEVRLTYAKFMRDQPIHVVTYDLERNKMTRRVEISPLRYRFGVTKCLHMDFWEDIETVVYLET
ncbi:F-box domain [Arabidopsis thaliana x Arabidopsis arenosa]|uniref:F-box domain n=1 Tax=Arabidopsis thaliana x Arabidopsis arenosa TaxID=1240361 RepID=A0A8T1ZM81_9BRAS|nr:F-box domain [Arabidopsis thaliana x Arabidopsis arenosa]